jgi:ubiquinone/menaquinone biosynthesis C-methylase UbiE
MIEIARSEYPEIDFRVGDAAEALEFQQSQFNAVVMNFALLHLAQPETALLEIHRVLRSSGRFAFSVWAKPEKAVALDIAFDAIEKFCDSSRLQGAALIRDAILDQRLLGEFRFYESKAKLHKQMFNVLGFGSLLLALLSLMSAGFSAMIGGSLTRTLWALDGQLRMEEASRRLS